MNDLAHIALDLIDIRDRLRPVKDERVEVLAADIELQGLLQPIVVAPDGDRFVLVAGAYRLAAATRLKLETIPARIVEGRDDAELRFAEIMENVDRQELSKLERAEFLAELDAAWKRMNPSARHGGDRRSANVRVLREQETLANDQVAILAIRSEVAEKAGLSDRAIRRATLIARGLTVETKGLVRGTPFEDNQAELEKLAGLDAEMQAKVCDLLFADPAKAGSVAEAVLIARGQDRQGAAKNLFSRLNANWGRMPRMDRLQFVRTHKDEILDLARSEGWI